MSTKRLLVSTALAVLAAASLVGVSASAHAVTPPTTPFPQPASARAGAAWLGGQLTSAGFIPSTTTPGTADLSATANAVLALAGANSDPNGAYAALDYLAGHVDAFVVSGGADGPAQLALLILDAHALGQSPTSFGGTDLVARLLVTQQTAGPDAGLFGSEDQAAAFNAGNYQQGLALAALAAAGVTGTTAVQAGVNWLTAEQCPSGGWTTPDNTDNACSGSPVDFAGPDTNATALALEGLAAQGPISPTVSTDALTFLTGGQVGDGGWSYLPNSVVAPQDTDPNSTALVIQGLVALGLSPTDAQFVQGSGDPVTALTSFQIISGSGAGAFSFPGLVGPNLLATNQAVPAIAGVSLPFVAPFVSDGYWLASADGGIFNYGTAGFFGSHGGSPLNQPIVGLAPTSDGSGYWLVARDGGIFNYGTAGFFGSHGGSPLNQPIVGMAATPDGKGYWLVAADGGIFAYGDAAFEGSHGGSPLNQPIVGMAATSDGKGYWLVAADGGIFAYGDAVFQGSLGGSPLNKPIVGMAGTPDGNGYWLVASDGGIFAYGDATFHGSLGGSPLNKPIVGMAATPDGQGYWLAGSDGGVFAYGDARLSGLPWGESAQPADRGYGGGAPVEVMVGRPCRCIPIDRIG